MGEAEAEYTKHCAEQANVQDPLSSSILCIRNPTPEHCRQELRSRERRLDDAGLV
jgi:hypothetical protein